MSSHILFNTANHTLTLAKLDEIPESTKKKLHQQLNSTIEYVSQVETADTHKVRETHQITGLTNISREDIVDTKRQLTVDEVVANAPQSHQGYIVVPALIEV
jgi:aspartyl/glutamyl-tRNA(Asn/Gln) amidotransferase C subunit